MVHSYTNRSQVSELIAPPHLPFEDNAKKEVFLKTFTFFCSLHKHGCAFEAGRELVGVDTDDASHDIASDHDPDIMQDVFDACQGKLVMRVNKFNQRYIQ